MGWLVGAWCCRDVCPCLVILRRHEIRTIDWKLVGHSYTIAWWTTYIRLHRSTTATSHRIVCRHLPVASSTLVFHAVGRRVSSFFLGPGRARVTTAAAPMTLLRPASLPLPRQRLFFPRRSNGGTPFDFRYIERRYYFRFCRALRIHNHSYLRLVAYVRQFIGLSVF